HQSNDENFDRAILTLSTASLGFSVAFLRGLEPICCRTVLVLSWGFLVIAILTTVVSLKVSQKTISLNLEFIERYYLQWDESAYQQANRWSKLHDWFSYGSGLAFIVGVILLLIFFGENVS